MEKHSKFQPEIKRTFLTLLTLAVETVLCAGSLLRIPADTKNAFLFGLSKERLLLLSGFGAILLIIIAGSVWIRKTANFYSSFTEQKRWTTLFFASALLFYFLYFLPDYRFGNRFAAYAVRLKPYFLWFALTAATIYVSIRKSFSFRNSSLFVLGREKAFPIFILFSLFLTLFIELTGLGKTTETALWNKNGVPLQSIQLFFCALGYGLLDRLCRRFKAPKKAILFTVVWFAAAAVWSFAPITPHFFSPGPYDPNYEFYPYSDAIAYDLPAYSALQGWGFNFHGILLKPIVTYTAFLSKLIAGGNYNLSMLVQSAIYGILPAILFLFGNAIGGTGCGLLTAVFSILKEWNALNSAALLTVHSRLVMSEFAMQIICAAFCYCVFRWLNEKGSVLPWAAASGSLFSLGVFTRYNFIAFLPAAFLLVLIVFRKEWKQKVWKAFSLFFLSAFIVAAPWLIRSKTISGRYFPEIYDTFQRTLLNRRYQMDSHEGKAVINSEDIIYQKDETIEASPQNSTETNQTPVKRRSILWSIFNHGLHNFRAAFLTLPMQASFDDLEHLYKNETGKLWSDDWNNQFTLIQWGFLIGWIIVLSFACVCLWKSFGIAGLSIPYFWFVYAFSIGVSRSSGGRYVVPENWIPMLLLALFISALFKSPESLLKKAETKEISFPVRKTFLTIASFSLYFISMILFEHFIPEKSLPRSENPQEIFSDLKETREIDWKKVQTQLNEGKMNYHSGTILYPRFYYYRVGEHAQYGSFAWKEYSRLIFYGVNYTEKGGEQMEYVLPHTELINDLPNESRFAALSCTSPNGYEDVLALQTVLPNGSVLNYVRDPLPTFECPVPEPVCDGIENCH